MILESHGCHVESGGLQKLEMIQRLFPAVFIRTTVQNKCFIIRTKCVINSVFTVFVHHYSNLGSLSCRLMADFSLQCIFQARGKATLLWERGPVLVSYHSLKRWVVSRSQARQLVLLTTQWTCFIGTSLEVSSNWRPEPWGSGPLPGFTWTVNYTVGGAGGQSQGSGAETGAQHHFKGGCEARAEIQLTTVSHSCVYTLDV